MNPEIEQNIQAAIGHNNQQLLVDMARMLDEKMGGLKRSSEAAANQQLEEIKKLKFSQMPDFKKRANKDQYVHNAKVLDSLDEAKVHLAEGKAVETASALDTGIKLMQDRQKLILIADQSPFGWLTVDNYKSNVLAEDEEDEKRLQRAENRANQQWKRRQAQRKGKVPDPKSPPASSAPSSSNATQNSGFHKTGACFACGKPGHWKYECQAWKQAKANQSNSA